MHKKFCASGFLYHSPTQQILLQQHLSLSSPASSWSLFSSAYTEKEEPEKVFKNVISKLLHIKITTINTVYSYFNEKTNINQVVVYTELNKLYNFTPKNELSFAWFSFKDVLKLQATEQIKHDIVVGQRVIQASERKNRGEHTFQ